MSYITRRPFVVFEVEHWTMPDLISTLQLLSDEDEASTFLSAYEDVCGAETAEHNLRYIFALIDRTEADRLSELFMLTVPEKSEVLEPRQTFGMSSYGISDVPMPDYSKKPARKFSASADPGLVEKDDEPKPVKTQTPMKRTMLNSAPESAI